ncbi:response regulator transcription factor [Paenibacillus sp. 1P07SE]|uniref:response regulator transcription factor n=1 Tax=Paenibacillus sp. 1P07SE TaxID=3132209 RepID=UPI0039A5DB0B
MLKVLLVEGDLYFSSFVQQGLEREGHYDVEVAKTVEDSFQKVIENKYDLIILDITIGGGRMGLDMLRSLRYRSLMVPVLILSMYDREPEVIEGLIAGANDYLAKPFSVTELLGKISNLNTRSAYAKKPNWSSKGGLTSGVVIHPQLPAIEIKGVTAPLPPIEYELFINLAKQPGIILSKEHLLHSVWGSNFMDGNRTLEIHINSLRRRLARFQEAIRIESFRGGYRYLCSGPWCQIRHRSN